MKWFEARGISPETVERFGIYRGKRGDIGDCIVFPYTQKGDVVNRKYRNRDKEFRQDAGARKILWNADVLDDPGLEEGTHRLIITEGEMDALSAIESGFPHVVSVPDGAPKTFNREEPDPDHDTKFSYIKNHWAQLAKVKRIVIATDGDGPGQVLAQELVRRLGAVRCLFVNYPPECKDLNEVLVRYGQHEVVRVLNSAKPYPVKGVYKLSDFPEIPDPKTFSTGWEHVDPMLKLYLGEFMVVTGIPGHGKSTWLLAMLANMVHLHGLKIGMASFEMQVKPYMRRELSKIHPEDSDEWIEENFVFIGSDPRNEEEEIDLDWLIDRASDAVIRYGINILVLDPWNEIEHKRDKGETETEYVNRAIRALKRFARSYNVAVIVVAHPVKKTGKDGENKPHLYDIAGSANWYNKCDHGVVVYREYPDANFIELDVKKSRFRAAGVPGSAYLEYNYITGRFCERPRETV